MSKIMLVEDDNNLREIYEARLAAEGYEIISAADGEAALALAIKEKPDLIISDIMMPKVSGFDMLDILRSTTETKNTKIIMMTALNQAEDKEKAESLGADLYLVKSQVTLEDVVRSAKGLLGEETPLSVGGVPVQVPPNAESSISSNTSPVTTSVQPLEVTTPQPVSEAPQPIAQSAPQPTPEPVAQPANQQPQPSPVFVAQTTPQANPATQAQQPVSEPTQSISTEDEEKALQQQIQQYINEEVTNPSTPQQQEPTPQPDPTTPQPSSFAQVPSSQQANTPASDGDPNEDRPAGEQVIVKNDDANSSIGQEPGIDASISGRKKVINPINDILSPANNITNLVNIDTAPDADAPEFNTIVTPDGTTLSATPPVATSQSTNTSTPIQVVQSNTTGSVSQTTNNPPLVNDIIVPNQQETAQVNPKQPLPPPVA